MVMKSQANAVERLPLVLNPSNFITDTSLSVQANKITGMLLTNQRAEEERLTVDAEAVGSRKHDLNGR